MIKDSYSQPSFDQFDWSEVDWSDPLPNDLVALAELAADARNQWIKHMTSIIAAGGTKDDLPRLAQWVWDYAVVPSGMASGDLDVEQYNRFGDLEMAGNFVRDDRMIALMSDEELNDLFSERAQMRGFVDSMDFDDLADSLKQKRESRDEEIAILKSLLE